MCVRVQPNGDITFTPWLLALLHRKHAPAQEKSLICTRPAAHSGTPSPPLVQVNFAKNKCVHRPHDRPLRRATINFVLPSQPGW